jgi:hypothetical protein
VDEFVAGVDFEDAAAEHRQKFFEWLRKAHSNLKPKTLAEVASYPIWPDKNGNHRPLNYYCWPSSLALRALILEVKAVPAENVVSFPGLRRSSNGALLLRSSPTMDELQQWYKKRIDMARALHEEGADSEAKLAFLAVDEELERLRRGGFEVDEIAEDHVAFSSAGALRSIRDLHVNTREVEKCGLLADDLVIAQFDALYSALGAQIRPTIAALLSALRSDPDQSRLYARLGAFKASGASLGDLAGEPIVQIGHRLMAPGELAFTGTIDYWGKWKTSFGKSPAVPESVELLLQSGVLRQALREELSCAFFVWLAAQTQSVQQRHLPQILRHWRERTHGPSKWWGANPTIKCLPVRGASGLFELVSHWKATHIHSKIFLSDFPEVQERVLLSVSSSRLVVSEAKDVGGSILDIVRDAGVESLKRRAGRPTRIVPSGDMAADQALEQALKNVQSPRIVKTLNQRLPQHEVPTSALRHEWRRLLLELNGVRVMANPTAIFTILRTEYEVAVQSGVDEPTRLVCIDSRADRKLAFYDALAAYIFTEKSSQLLSYGLLRAVENPFAPILLDVDSIDINEVEDDEDSDTETNTDQDTEDPPRRGHGISTDKLNPIVPEPSRLADISDRTTLSGKKITHPKKRSPRPSTDDRRHTIEEEDQKLQLKEKHYAWHCQACLGEYEVLEVTPPGSYVYLPTFRQKLIHAHHVTHLQNSGYIGDKLSNASVKGALATARKVSRRFPNNPDGTQGIDRQGLVAEVRLDTDPLRVALFFTAEHANAWTK